MGRPHNKMLKQDNSHLNHRKIHASEARKQLFQSTHTFLAKQFILAKGSEFHLSISIFHPRK